MKKKKDKWKWITILTKKIIYVRKKDIKNYKYILKE